MKTRQNQTKAHRNTARITLGRTARGFASFEGNYLLALYQMREDPDMKAYLDSYYRSVAEQEELLEGNIPPLFEWDPVHDERKYVGTQACRTCHSAQWEQWQTTRHADAYTTLLDAHRHQFSKCVKCHVAGLNRDRCQMTSRFAQLSDTQIRAPLVIGLGV